MEKELYCPVCSGLLALTKQPSLRCETCKVEYGPKSKVYSELIGTNSLSSESLSKMSPVPKLSPVDSTTKVERGISNGDEQIILLRGIHFWVRACGMAAFLFMLFMLFGGFRIQPL